MFAKRIACTLSTVTVCALLVAAIPAPAPAVAGSQVFLRVDGLAGTSVVQTYQGWMDVDDFRIDIDNGARPGPASSTRLLPVLSNLEVSATMMPNFPELAALCAAGTVVKNVSLDVVSTTPAGLVPHTKLQLDNAVIAKIATELDGDGNVRQVVQIAYSRISMTTRDGTGRERTMTWNLATNSAK